MSDEQDEMLSAYGEGDFEIIRGEDVVVSQEIANPEVPDDPDAPETTEIYYMLCYNVQMGKWYSADGMINVLTNGSGTVLEGKGSKGHWRHLAEGLEADLDYDNVEALGEFLRSVNKDD